MYKDEFSAAELVKLESIVQSRDYQRQSKRNVPYYMSAYLQRRMGAADLELAHLFLAASWESEGHWSPHGKSENGDGVSPAAERKRRQSAYRAMALKKLDSFLTQNSERTEQWWRATALGIELARLLHRFDDAKTRLNALPLQELPLNSKTGKLIAQIREQVTRRNANPEVFVTE
jgi:hypothetical protein